MAMGLNPSLFGCIKTLNYHAGHYNGPCFFCYKSLAATARELFKPSKNAASLLGSIKKKTRLVVRMGEARKVGVFLIF